MPASAVAPGRAACRRPTGMGQQRIVRRRGRVERLTQVITDWCSMMGQQ
jgi:hypothetical protein